MNAPVNADYIRGFADADGCFSNCHIALDNTELILLERIKDALKIWGIEGKLESKEVMAPHHSPRFRLRIHGYYNLKRWQEQIGFNHPKKRKRLAGYLAHLERPGALYNQAESEATMSLRGLGYSLRAIGRELGLPQATISGRFRRGLWPLGERERRAMCSPSSR